MGVLNLTACIACVLVAGAGGELSTEDSTGRIVRSRARFDFVSSRIQSEAVLEQISRHSRERSSLNDRSDSGDFRFLLADTAQNPCDVSHCATQWFERARMHLLQHPLRAQNSSDPRIGAVLLGNLDTSSAWSSAGQWAKGSVTQCRLWRQLMEEEQQTLFTNTAADLLQLISPQLLRVPRAPLVLFDLDQQWCTYQDGNISCGHVAVDHPRVFLATATLHERTIRRNLDIAFPLDYVDASDNGKESVQREDALPWEARPLLLSFRGGATHYLRRRLASLDNGQDIFVEVHDYQKGSGTGLDKVEYRTPFRCPAASSEGYAGVAGLMRCSRFALAPRGHSLHSSRVLEAMAYGAVPVVISDGWILPFEASAAGGASGLIDWGEIAIKIPEREWHRAPEIVQAVTIETWRQKQAAGREAFATYFGSLEASLDALLEILARRKRAVENKITKLSPPPQGSVQGEDKDASCFSLRGAIEAAHSVLILEWARPLDSRLVECLVEGHLDYGGLTHIDISMKNEPLSPEAQDKLDLWRLRDGAVFGRSARWDLYEAAGSAGSDVRFDVVLLSLEAASSAITLPRAAMVHVIRALASQGRLFVDGRHLAATPLQKRCLEEEEAQGEWRRYKKSAGCDPDSDHPPWYVDDFTAAETPGDLQGVRHLRFVGEGDPDNLQACAAEFCEALLDSMEGGVAMRDEAIAKVTTLAEATMEEGRCDLGDPDPRCYTYESAESDSAVAVCLGVVVSHSTKRHDLRRAPGGAVGPVCLR